MGCGQVRVARGKSPGGGYGPASPLRFIHHTTAADDQVGAFSDEGGDGEPPSHHDSASNIMIPYILGTAREEAAAGAASGATGTPLSLAALQMSSVSGR